MTRSEGTSTRDDSAVFAARSKWATALPTLCAIHCILAPILIGVLPIFAFEGPVEVVLFGVSAALAAWVLTSAVRAHGDRRVWVPYGVGVLLWAGAALVTGGSTHVALAAAGGLTVAATIFWSGQLRHRAVCRTTCSCPAPH